IWMERKGAAYIQDRRGPNRAHILGIRLGGLVHTIADVIKLFTKEEVTARGALRPLVYLAPIIAFFAATATVAAVPFSGPISVAGRTLTFEVANIQAGLVYVFAISSLGAYALVLAGWTSQNTYSFLGAMRAASQFLSYELALGMAAISIFLVAGSLSLTDIAADQGAAVWRWNAIRQPLAFLIFTTALFAEASRLPFDLPEGDSEIVAGYHVEYSSMRFAMFYMAEYAHIFVGSAVIATLFFGGWNVPFADQSLIAANADRIVAVAWPIFALALMLGGAKLAGRFRRRFKDMRDYEPVMIGVPSIIAGMALAGLYVMHGGWLLDAEWLPAAVAFATGFIAMLTKTMIISALFIWVRWTLPRFRYDQVMAFGWKMLLPAGLLNLVVTAGIMMYLKD
ncbi:MAG: complex I subunit 1 family protein, partial [bacterium]